MRSNCLFCALSRWYHSRFHAMFALRRSHGLGGWILHALVIAPLLSGRVWRATEFGPLRRKRHLLSRGSFPGWFEGKFRVAEWRLVAVASADTEEAAQALLARRVARKNFLLRQRTTR